MWERTQSADSRGLGDLGDLRADTRDYARRVKELKSQIVSVGPNFAKTWLPVIESLEDGIDRVQSRVLHRAEERWAVLQSSKDLSTTVCVRRYGAARAIRSTRASSPRRRVANKSPGRSSGDDPPPLPDLAPLTGGAT